MGYSKIKKQPKHIKKPFKVVKQFLEQKQKMLHEYDEQILDLCQVADIEKEIDEADELHTKSNLVASHVQIGIGELREQSLNNRCQNCNGGKRKTRKTKSKTWWK